MVVIMVSKYFVHWGRPLYRNCGRTTTREKRVGSVKSPAAMGIGSERGWIVIVDPRVSRIEALMITNQSIKLLVVYLR